MIRAQLVVENKDRAEAFFKGVFPRLQKVQDLVVTRQVPISFLRSVSKHRAASVTLRQMLAMYMSTDPEEVCDLVEHVFFAELMEEKHSSKVILKHAFIRDLVLWMRSGGNPDGARMGAGALLPSSAEASALRLREVGVKLFAATFILHDGYLGDGSSECPWDDGSLDLPLLEHVPQIEDALQLARRVLLHCLWRGAAEGGDKYDVSTITRLWRLGRWSYCQDVVLIGKALAFLSACWRALAGLPGLGDLAGFTVGDDCRRCGTELRGARKCPKCDQPRDVPGMPTVVPNSLSGATLMGSGTRQNAEELLFKMFTDLEVWRLPSKDLLTPWVPGQVLTCHVVSQCRQLEERQTTLVQETKENLQEISRLQTTIAQLTARLEATDARSQQCMQRQADLNDTLRGLR
jgi:hypothetical protein